MERKIGEIFEFGGDWYQCINTGNCSECAFTGKQCYDFGTKGADIIGNCTGRTFKKLEKVGEPYMLEDKKFQKYKVFKTPYIYNKIDCSWQSFADPYYVSLEIKPTKEDMEEKKMNLKPFDIEAAKAGKPVCTRDGRKARIICFDREYLYEGRDYSIVALVSDSFGESVHYYFSNGKVDFDGQFDDDLMMLPEKRSGWINIYTFNTFYSSKEEAEANIDRDYENEYIGTTEIEWEE